MPLSLIAMLAAYLMCWQAYKLRERLNGLGHAGVLVSLVATLLNSVTARISDAYSPSLLTYQYILFLHQVFITSSCLGLYLLRLAVEGKTVRDRSVRRVIGGGVLFCCCNAGIIAVAITSGHLLGDGPVHAPLDVILSLGAGLYFGTVMLLVAVWMWRYVNRRPLRIRLGTRVAAIGLFGMAGLGYTRAATALVAYLGGPPSIAPSWLRDTVTSMAFPLVFLGLSFPLLASRWTAFQEWMSRRRVCERAKVTAQTCRSAYPEIELPAAGIGERLRLFIANHHTQARIIVESFDGLAKLLVHDAPAATPAGRCAAERLRAAVRRYDAHHPQRAVIEIISPTADDRTLDGEGVPQQPGTTLEEDIAVLIDLAAELDALSDDGSTVAAQAYAKVIQ